MENKHESFDLAQMQFLDLDSKIAMTKQRIKDWYEYWNGLVYVSFSGGKDSTVLKHLVDSMYDDVPAFYSNTGLEYPEVQNFVRDMKLGKFEGFNTDIEIRRPAMRFDEVIKTYGYPVISKEVSQSIYEANQSSKLHEIEVRLTGPYNRKFNPQSEYCQKYPSYCMQKWDKIFDAPFGVSHMCCMVMKKKPVKEYEKETGRMPIIGTMACESRVRKTQWIRMGCNAFEAKRPRSAPLSFWTENDILEYISRFKIPFASVYGEIVETGNILERISGEIAELKTTGCDRTGCMFCMFGCHLGNDERFLRIKETHPKQYEYMMKPFEEGGLGIRNVIDWMNSNCNTNIKY